MAMTTNELAELTDVPRRTLQEWVDTGHLSPIVSGYKRRPSEFDLMALVAVNYAKSLRTVGFTSCALDGMRHVSRLTEQELREHLENGETVLIPSLNQWLNPSQISHTREQGILYASMNLDRIYRTAKRTIRNH